MSEEETKPEDVPEAKEDAEEDVAKEDVKEEAQAEADAPTGDALFDALWTRVMEAWDDDKPHAAILDLALKNQMLPELAGRYRKLKEVDAAKAARAQKKIDGIVVAATQMLMSMKTPPRTKTPVSWTLSVGAVCLIVIIWLAYKLYGAR